MACSISLPNALCQKDSVTEIRQFLSGAIRLLRNIDSKTVNVLEKGKPNGQLTELLKDYGKHNRNLSKIVDCIFDSVNHEQNNSISVDQTPNDASEILRLQKIIEEKKSDLNKLTTEKQELVNLCNKLQSDVKSLQHLQKEKDEIISSEKMLNRNGNPTVETVTSGPEESQKKLAEKEILIQKLKDSDEKKESSINSLKIEQEETQKKVKEYERKLEQLRSSIEKKDHEICQLKTKRSEISNQKEDNVSTEKLHEQLNTKDKELKENQDKLKEYETLKNKLQEKDIQIQALSNEVNEVKKSKDAQNKLSSSKEQDKSVLEKEIQKLKGEKSDLHKELEVASNSKSSLEEDVKNLKSQISEVQSKLAEKESAERQLTKQNDNLSRQLEEQKQLIEETESKQISISNQQGKYDSVLEKEIQKLKGEKSDLHKELEVASNSKSSLEENVNNLKSQISEVQSKLDEKKSVERQLTLKNEDLSRRLEEQKKLIEETKSKQRSISNQQGKYDEVASLKDKVEELTEKLSKEMNTKVAGNESALENISIVCRPMNVATEYEHVCSNVWLDAKTYIQDQAIGDDENASNFLTDILMVALKESTAMLQSIMQLEAHILTQPVEVVGDINSGKDTKGQFKDVLKGKKPLLLQNSVQNEIGDQFRLTVNEINLQYLNENITAAISEKHSKYTKHCKKQEIQDYILAAVNLAWKMAIQRPQMTFSMKGVGEKWKDDGSLEPSWGSDPSKLGAMVRYYVNPILCHGKKMMSKGKVFVN